MELERNLSFQFSAFQNGHSYAGSPRVSVRMREKIYEAYR